MRKHRSKNLHRLGGAIAIFLAIGCLTSLNAAPIHYGDFVGTTVKYLNVSEDPSQFPLPVMPNEPLFGAPSLLGDTLDFNPLFSIMAADGSVAVQDSKLHFDVMAVNDFQGIQSLTITEGGGYSVGPGTNGTFAQQSLILAGNPSPGHIFVTAIDGVAVTPIPVTPTVQYTFTPSPVPFITTTSSSIRVDATPVASGGSWNVVAEFDIDAAIAAAGMSGQATMLEVTLDNQLLAQAEQDTFAMIDKKDFKIGITQVPEPTAIGLGLLGGLGLLMTARRRRILDGASSK